MPPRRYIQLYKRKLELLRQGSYNLLPLGSEEVERLRQLEAAMPVDTILVCRGMAEYAIDSAGVCSCPLGVRWLAVPEALWRVCPQQQLGGIPPVFACQRCAPLLPQPLTPSPLPPSLGAEGGDSRRSWLAWGTSGISYFLHSSSSVASKAGAGLPDAPTEGDMQVRGACSVEGLCMRSPEGAWS